MNRAYYSSSISAFLGSSIDEVFAALGRNNQFSLECTQREAWLEEIEILQRALVGREGMIYFEFSIPRMGRRVDVILLIQGIIFVVEFKVGEKDFPAHAVDQVWDYSLDLKNFHEPSHNKVICPLLIATEAKQQRIEVKTTLHKDGLLCPILCNVEQIPAAIDMALVLAEGEHINEDNWSTGRYCPTPTIIEAATALYNGHAVEDISRNDASAINLSQTSGALDEILKSSKERGRKSICFVTGVPGAGKTLVGLNLAIEHFDSSNDLYSVFLSGNGPLVAILREALTRDKVARSAKSGTRMKKGEVFSQVKGFVQNVHNFRDEYLDDTRAPIEHIVLFDEAQRAWDKEQTSAFMRQKKKRELEVSEPQFLISCLERQKDWAVIVCLVGGGQEINKGEAGISEWLDAVQESYPHWDVYISSRLTDSEYLAGDSLARLQQRENVYYRDELHLAVSMRSFRAENVSLLVKQLLDLDSPGARRSLQALKHKYPIVISRDLQKAKRWLRDQSRGSERYGIVASSQAERLKPHAVDVKSPMDPIHWFLEGKEDVRSSYYLESVATEFHVQGLELDWVCVTWDGDFRYSEDGWKYHSFRGDRWLHVKQEDRRKYLKNAYRVLLTRARQGMVIVVPDGAEEDPTRSSKYYDPTFQYLKDIGFDVI